MSLKTSFFNKSIFRTDIKRFWWISLLETLMLLIACVIPFYDRCNSSYYYNYNHNPILSNTICIPFFVAFCVGISILLMSYLQSVAPMSGMHSLPLKRQTLLFSKIISAAVLALVPILINGIILMVMLTDNIVGTYCTIPHILTWMFTGFVYSLVIITLTFFVNMMTGNAVGTLVFTGGFMALPITFEEMLIEIFDETVYGYTSRTAYLSRYIYLSEDAIIRFPTCFIYPALIITLIAGAYLLYRSRKLESFGEVIAFGWLKPVFIGLISALTSLLGFYYFWAITDEARLIHIIPFGIIGTVIAQMIARKSLKLKGMWKPVVIYIAAAICFIGIVKFDLTGYERRIPKLEKIESAKITYDYDYSDMTGRISPYFTEVEDIKNIMALHSHLIENRHEASEQTETIPIEYRLKNGRVLSREYEISYEKDQTPLKPLYETVQIKASRFPIVNGEKKEYVKLEISDARYPKTVAPLNLYPSSENMNKLLDAIREDVLSFTYEDYILTPSEGSIQIIASYIPENKEHAKQAGLTERYNISEKYKNTIAVLKEIGFYDRIPTAADIEGATVIVWKSGEPYFPARELPFLDNAYSTEVSVTDPEEIAKLYSLFDSMTAGAKYYNSQNHLNIKIAYRVKGTGFVFEVSCPYDTNKIPDVLKKYFEGKI